MLDFLSGPDDEEQQRNVRVFGLIGTDVGEENKKARIAGRENKKQEAAVMKRHFNYQILG